MINIIYKLKKIVKFVFFVIILITSFIFQNIFCTEKKWKLIDSIPGMFYKSIENSKDFTKIVSIGGKNSVQAIRISLDKGKSWFNIIDTVKVEIDTVSKESKAVYFPIKLFDISVTDEDIIYIGCDSGRIKTSGDFGKIWRIIKTPFTKDEIKYLKFNDLGNGLIAKNKNFSFTSDYGETWVTRPYPDNGDYCRFTSFNFEKIALITFNPNDNNYNHYYISRDTGKTWSEITLERITDFCFVDENTIFAIGNYFNGLHIMGVRSRIYKSTDSGINWDIKMDTILDYSNGLYNLKFKNTNFGVAFGDNESIWQTEDGGETWYLLLDHYIRKSSSSNSMLADVAFLEDGGLVGVTVSTFKKYIYDPKDPLVVNNSKANEGVNIFPNPAGEYIEISGLNKGLQPLVHGIEITIFNLLGECVLSVAQTFPSVDSGQTGMSDLLRIDVSGLPAGVYFVRVGEWVGRFVKI